MPNGRCRMHGGRSTGAPKGNRNAFRHGHYTAAAIAGRRATRALIQDARALIAQVDALDRGGFEETVRNNPSCEARSHPDVFRGLDRRAATRAERTMNPPPFARRSGLRESMNTERKEGTSMGWVRVLGCSCRRTLLSGLARTERGLTHFVIRGRDPLLSGSGRTKRGPHSPRHSRT